ncbi:MAG: hypothetical protein KC503_16860 [Myxococcales bacterium]|nr:hypothetical protein [Myxococcales bacterium]
MRVGRPIDHVGGIFRRLHDELVGVPVDFTKLDADDFSPELAERARTVWGDRVMTEFRSVQVMLRFATDVVAAGDPLEVYAGAADAVLDEIRHTALCVGVVEALGGEPCLPDPLVEEEHDTFEGLPPAERALIVGINMLAINETISTCYIRDLHQRCDHPVLSQVLGATVADEEAHHEFGWSYIEASIARFDDDARALWRNVTAHALREHFADAETVLARVPPEQRRLDAWPEPELAHAGLLGFERQSLLFERVYEEELGPKLTALGLLGDAS